MAIIAKCENKNEDYPMIPEGVHLARCVSIIDVGTQLNNKFQNYSRQVVIQWEIPNEMIEINGEKKPRLYSQDYTLSLHAKAKLRKHLEAWRGKSFTDEELDGFDMKNVLGKVCQLQIIHNKKNDNVYANLGSIMACPKGSNATKQISESIYIDWEDPEFKNKVLKLPKWIQNKIKDAKEFKNDSNDDMPAFDLSDDDLPF
jgi:hypothetical protein